MELGKSIVGDGKRSGVVIAEVQDSDPKHGGNNQTDAHVREEHLVGLVEE